MAETANPSIALVIPYYNACDYVGAAIESALSQTRPADDIVVVDDGSTDGGETVITGFGRHVRYVRQPNAGVSAARNTGLSMVAAELVAFLDADDVLPAESIASRLGLLETNPDLGYAYGGVEQFFSEALALGEQSRLSAASRSGRIAGSLLIRRRLFAAVGLFDPSIRIGETIDWIARCDLLGFVGGDCGAPVLRRRIHESNATRSPEGVQAQYLQVLRAALTRRRAAGVA